MSYYGGQIPLHYEIVGPDGKMNQQWAFWFQNFVNNLPPAGSSFVINADPNIAGNQYLYQGTAVERPAQPPQPSSIFVETDTGSTFIEKNGNWVLQDPAYIGDVTKPQNSDIVTLNVVNGSPGVYGSSTTIPVIKVNDKGLVVASYEVPIAGGGVTPGGPNYSIQYNDNGQLVGSSGFTYNPTGNILSVPNIAVSGQITFSNPLPTFNNLSPLTTKGDLLTHDSTNNIRLGVGADGSVLVADSASPSGLSWQTITITGAQNVPYYVQTGETYLLPIYKQANFILPIELATGGYLDIEGYLIELINQ
jgi:hypothetical protein